MDAHALLTSQGWRGSGHSLHPTTDKTGLSRPLLVAQKQNNLGVGKKQHRTSDMWWMNAFDKSLKGLDTSEEGTVVQTLTNGGLDMVAKGGSKFVGNGGLYACFVRGESLTGTITPEEDEEASDTCSNKRKRVGQTFESKEERRATKAHKRALRGLCGESRLIVSTITALPLEAEDDQTVELIESKEERRERRRLKKLIREQEQSKEAVGSIEITQKRKKKWRKS